MPEHIQQRRLLRWTIVLSLAILGAFVLDAWSFYLAHQNALTAKRQSMHDRRILCQAQNDSSLALRRVLTLAESLSAQAKNITPEQRRRAIDFYRQALELTTPVKCSALTGGP